MRLRKQRYLCRCCNSSFTLSSKLVDKSCFISNATKYKIALDASLKRSEKDIAKDNYVSHVSVSKIIAKLEEKQTRNRGYLPKHLSFDEFAATKDTKKKMAFIMIDADKGTILEIYDDRRYEALLKLFGLYSHDARANVETIAIDMYTPYMKLINTMFPNAELIIDKFHIVQLVSSSLNKTIIQLMNKDKKNDNKFKRYWKLILKTRDDINDCIYKKYVCFSDMMREIDIVDYLLETDKGFQESYLFYQEVLSTIRKKDYQLLEETLESDYPHLSSYMKTSLETLKKYKQYIKNTLSFDYSNGTIEGINNLIKVIKRIAFGYRCFLHFKTRIFIIANSIIQEKAKKQRRSLVSA